MRIVGTSGIGHDLGDAAFFQLTHEREGFCDGTPDGQQTVIAQDQGAVIADAGDQAFALTEFERSAFIVVITDPVIETHRILIDR